MFHLNCWYDILHARYLHVLKISWQALFKKNGNLTYKLNQDSSTEIWYNGHIIKIRYYGCLVSRYIWIYWSVACHSLFTGTSPSLYHDKLSCLCYGPLIKKKKDIWFRLVYVCGEKKLWNLAPFFKVIMLSPLVTRILTNQSVLDNTQTVCIWVNVKIRCVLTHLCMNS